MKIDYKTLYNLKKQNKSDTEIGKIFNTSRSMIRYYRKKFGVSLTCKCPGNRIYNINEKFFHSIDTQEKAYILGILSADGYIDSHGKAISIALHKKDTHILRDIQRCVGSNAPIHTKKYDRKSFGKSDLSVINLCSKAMVSDLNSIGVTRNKSKILEYPNIPKRLESHYIRGILDGDGNISPRQFSIVGTDNVLNGIMDAVFKHTGHLLSSCPCNNLPRIVGYKRNKPVLDWIYKNSSIHLLRKYNLFQKYWTDISCARVASSP